MPVPDNNRATEYKPANKVKEHCCRAEKEGRIMQLERKHKPIVKYSKKRKMVNIKSETHARIAQLAYETGYSITDLTDMLLCDALARVKLIDEKSEEAERE